MDILIIFVKNCSLFNLYFKLFFSTLASRKWYCQLFSKISCLITNSSYFFLSDALYCSYLSAIFQYLNRLFTKLALYNWLTNYKIKLLEFSTHALLKFILYNWPNSSNIQYNNSLNMICTLYCSFFYFRWWYTRWKLFM